MLEQFFQIFQGIYTLFTGDLVIAVARILLIALAFLLIYLGYKKVLEPLLGLLPKTLLQLWRCLD